MLTSMACEQLIRSKNVKYAKLKEKLAKEHKKETGKALKSNFSLEKGREQKEIFEKLKTDYYALEIHCSENEFFPVKNKAFLDNLHSVMFLTDNLRPPMEFFQTNFPITCNNMVDWLDLHVILTSAGNAQKTKPKNLPAVILNCGGRKILIPVGGNRYSYDMGKLPNYKLVNNGSEILLSCDPSDRAVLSNKSTFGLEPLRTSLSYISYPDILKNLKEYYGNSYSDSNVAKEIRKLLKGEQLSPGHSPYLPVLTSALFASEVARNPVCMISGLMLLDLIEVQAIAPGENRAFGWENALVSPGFHPMVHPGSWADEFVKGKYHIEDPLNFSHLKSLIILAEWSKLYFSKFIEGFKIKILNKKEYEERYKLGLEEHVKHFSQYDRRKSLERHKYDYENCIRVALASHITSVMGSKLYSIDNNLNSVLHSPSSSLLSPTPSLSSSLSSSFPSAPTSGAEATPVSQPGQAQQQQRMDAEYGENYDSEEDINAKMRGVEAKEGRDNKGAAKMSDSVARGDKRPVEVRGSASSFSISSSLSSSSSEPRAAAGGGGREGEFGLYLSKQGQSLNQGSKGSPQVPSEKSSSKSESFLAQDKNNSSKREPKQ